MAAIRRCRVRVTDADGVTHGVEVLGSSVYEVAAAGLAQLREQGWVEVVAPNTVLQVEVHTAPTVHNVPLKSLQRWAASPSISPKQELLKQPLRRA